MRLASVPRHISFFKAGFTPGVWVPRDGWEPPMRAGVFGERRAASFFGARFASGALAASISGLRPRALSTVDRARFARAAEPHIDTASQTCARSPFRQRRAPSAHSPADVRSRDVSGTPAPGPPAGGRARPGRQGNPGLRSARFRSPGEVGALLAVSTAPEAARSPSVGGHVCVII
ncbi:hypothetical protein GCM10009654_08260 [Streptomyces hebeiensis]|uniref:Uncharacterized protein n=1 Tax=Streptomyces hebeiensis TaxID=229486 RepID=A0ABN1UM84_9ACTN